MSRLMQYIESRRGKMDPSSTQVPPWEDVTLRVLPETALPRDIVAENLRVFVAECTWRWAQEQGIAYEQAKEQRLLGDFARIYNAGTFEATMLSRGLVAEEVAGQWESATKIGDWIPYEPDVNALIEQAHQQGVQEFETRLGPKAWKYVISFQQMVQRNPHTGQERTLMRIEAGSAADEGASSPQRKGKLTLEELAAGIKYFVDMVTLPPDPNGPPEDKQDVPESQSNLKPAGNGVAAATAKSSGGDDLGAGGAVDPPGIAGAA